MTQPLIEIRIVLYYAVHSYSMRTEVIPGPGKAEALQEEFCKLKAYYRVLFDNLCDVV